MLGSFAVAAILGLWTAAVHSAPAGNPSGLDYGIKFESWDGLPTLTIGSGRWKASKYDLNGDIYVFKNIRFGAPPVGPRRWAAPEAPEFNETVSDGSYGPICHQTAIKGLNILGPFAGTSIGAALNQFAGKVPLPLFTGGSEDCLFLDLYVPGKAVRDPENHRLPVVVWFYGGAFVFGSKDALEPIPGFYDGTGLLRQSLGEIIYITGNYRLGAFGWMAGNTMEKSGLPNAGLQDQRMVLQWVQDNIGYVGGDKDEVSAWGESAGASSILHHLVQEGGTRDPMFKRAVLQSPAYEVFIDRRGKLENTFDTFLGLAGCGGQGMDCLRQASEATLSTANDQLNADAFEGQFSVGPAPDGKIIRQSPTLELASGNYWKGLESLIISHTKDESEIFVDGAITTDEQFNAYVQAAFPKNAQGSGLNSKIEEQYPRPGFGSKYSSERERTKALVRDVSFTCNTRYLSTAYAGKNFNMQYSVLPGWHAFDLLPTFYNLDVVVNIFGNPVNFPLVPSIANQYQSYLTSHARSGDPNTYRQNDIFKQPNTIYWPHPSDSDDALGDVLDVDALGFSLIDDQTNLRSACDFWIQAIGAATELGGYSPPGAIVPTNLVEIQNNPSVNYTSA